MTREASETNRLTSSAELDPAGFHAANLDIFEAARNGQAQEVPTWDVLSWYGKERRGSVVNSRIREDLSAAGLSMNPDIADADYYGYVSISATPAGREDTTSDEAESESPNDETPPPPSTEAGTEAPIDWVLSSLKDDAGELDCLKYSDTVETAVERMKQRGRSKLPLFFDPADQSTFIGTVTMASLTFEDTSDSTRIIDCVDNTAPVFLTSEKLFACIPSILSSGYVYGKDAAGNVVQIYTAHDVASYLHKFSQTFLRVNELEDRIRHALHSVPEADLKAAAKDDRKLSEIPIDEESKVTLTPAEVGNSHAIQGHVSDSFTFAQYMKCFSDQGIWSTYFKNSGATPLNKEDCIRSLNDARIVRNGIMHMNSKGAANAVTARLEALAVWLRRLDC